MSTVGVDAGAGTGAVWSIGLASFCLSQPGQAEIEGVDLIGGGGLEVQAFATKPGPPEFFFDPVTLEGSGIGTGTTVSQVCDDTMDPRRSVRMSTCRTW